MEILPLSLAHTHTHTNTHTHTHLQSLHSYTLTPALKHTPIHIRRYLKAKKISPQSYPPSKVIKIRRIIFDLRSLCRSSLARQAQYTEFKKGLDLGVLEKNKFIVAVLVQSVSRIWTSLVRLNLVMVVWL